MKMRKMQAGGIPRMRPPPMGQVRDPAPAPAPSPPSRNKITPAKMEAMRAAQRAARGGRSGMPAAPTRAAMMKKGGDVKKYSNGGGIYRKAADGVATRGKTRGTEIKMRKGGMC